MAFCRRPGTVADFVLPSDENAPEEHQSHVGIRVPTEAMRREIDAIKNRIAKNPTETYSGIRKIYSLALDYFTNLKFEDGSEFQLERDDKGEITKESFEVLVEYADEIGALLNRCGRVSEAERKNF